MNFAKDIFEYVNNRKAAYQLPIQINDAWEFCMPKHIKTTENYIHSQLADNMKGDYTPVKNITKANLDLAHWTEDVDLKDVQLYVDDPDQFHLSLLVKKYHDDVFVKENDLDSFFDELRNSRIDYGGGLSKKLFKSRPELCPLQKILFCSQKDILSAPFAFEHEYSPDELLSMAKKGWGNTANGATHTVEELITMWRNQEKDADCLKIVEVHGTLPAIYANPEAGEFEYETRIFIISFIRPRDSDKDVGVILYTAEENISETFKLTKRDPIEGRALGFGGAEELFEAQVWTNYDMIRMQRMLDAASVTLLQSSDPTVIARNPKGLKHMKNMEIVETSVGGEVRPIDTFPRNMRLFETSVANWEQHGKEISGAQDPIQGGEAKAGTPFAAISAQIQQGMGIHKSRRKEFARHIEAIYRDWIIPHIEKEITKDFKFLSELSTEELTFVVKRLEKGQWNKDWNEHMAQKTLNGESFVDGEYDAFIEKLREDFKGKGNQHFLGALKGDFKGAKLKVSVAGGGSNLAEMADKITKIFQQAFANPDGFMRVLQIPGMATSFNKLMEFSGMNPSDFSGLEKLMAQQSQVTPQAAQLPAQMMQNAAQPA